MTPEEAVALVAYVEECCPSQKIGEYTSDAWYDVLGRWPLEDCRAAVIAVLASGSRWVNVGDVAAEVRRVRGLRLANSDTATQPPRPVDETTYRQGMKRIIGALASSGDDQPPPFKALEAARQAVNPGDAAEYKRLREKWNLERQAKKEAALADRLARADAEREATLAQREITEAWGWLLAIPSDDAMTAMELARAELGDDAHQDDVVKLAATLTDARPVNPGPPSKATADALLAIGCPNGCPSNAHSRHCPYAKAAKR